MRDIHFRSVSHAASIAALVTHACSTPVVSPSAPETALETATAAAAMIPADDGGCGDGWCSPSEDCSWCPNDCGTCGGCGDGWCAAGEDCSGCPNDCGSCGPVCGNGIPEAGEDCWSCPSDTGSCPATTLCNGDAWGGCDASGGAICSEKLRGLYPCYFQLHPNCHLSTSCGGNYSTCSADCPPPSTFEACGGADGSAGGWSNGCRGNGAAVCVDRLGSGYPCYFRNHPGCMPNCTCGGYGYQCNAACPAPTSADATCSGTCTLAAGYPQIPGTSTPLCPPYSNPVVFFAPHPDDETLGMAGAIIEAAAAGRTVIVELMTHGEGSNARSYLIGERNSNHYESWGPNNGTSPLHGPIGFVPFNSSAPDYQDFGDARVRELVDSMSRIAALYPGHIGVRTDNHTSAGATRHDGSLAVSEVSERVSWWAARLSAGEISSLALRGTPPAASSYADDHPDHKAVGTALAGAPSNVEVQYFLVYNQAANRHALSGLNCTAKRNSLDAYRRWDPGAGRFAIGWWHSSSPLFFRNYDECAEYSFAR